MRKNIINLYIVDNSEQFTNKTEEIFYDRPDYNINVIGGANKYKACMDDIENARKADIFIISAFLPDKKGVELIEHLKKNVNPEAKYIVSVTANTRNLVDKALESGADDFLQKPFRPQAMIEKIYSLVGKEFIEEVEDMEEEPRPSSYHYEDNEEEVEVDVFEVDKPEPVLQQEVELNKNKKIMDSFDYEQEAQRKPVNNQKRESSFVNAYGISPNYYGGVGNSNKPNRIVTFTSPSSAGKTAVLVNTAAAIRKHSEFDPKVIIVDLNVVYPSVQFALNYEDLVLAKKTIYDLMDDITELDRELLSQAVIEHKPTGIHILDTPFKTIRDFQRVTVDKIKHLLLFLREEYDIVMVDTAGDIRDGATMIPISLADTNVLLFQSDFTSLVKTRKFIEMVQLHEKIADRSIINKTMLILNRYDKSSNLSVEKAKNTILDIEGIELNIPLYIPEDSAMTNYMNKGEFIVDSEGEASDKLTELASMIYPFYTDGDVRKRESKKQNKSLFGSLINKFKPM